MIKVTFPWVPGMTQWVKCPPLAQGMISWFVSSSPMSGSALTAQSLEPASDSVSPSHSLCPSSLVRALSLKNKHFLKRDLSSGQWKFFFLSMHESRITDPQQCLCPQNLCWC